MPYKDLALRKLKNKEYCREYYEKNKEALKQANNERRHVRKEQWRAFKRTLKCTNCGENHPATLDFHHYERNNPLNRKVHLLIRNGALKAAIDEIRERCIVLCANCHRKHHYAEHHGKKHVDIP